MAGTDTYILKGTPLEKMNPNNYGHTKPFEYWALNIYSADVYK